MGRNTLKLSTAGFSRLLTQLDKLGGDIEKVATDALEHASEKIGIDTMQAIQPGNLPAKGRYSGGETEASVVRNPRVVNQGDRLTVNVGFDYAKPGAGGYLINGRPPGKHGQMNAVSDLNQMYKGKKYMSQIAKDMTDIVQDEISKAMGGKR